jgi:lysylphosphatidylglycerol synthetase-like protein (DUF2156 family)
MDLSLTTPALIFPAISLLFLAYTNRFLTLANLTRELYARYKAEPDPKIKGQLHNLRYRISIIRHMQIFGVLAFFGCVLCMFLLFFGWELAGKYAFAASLVSLLVSLGLSMRELFVSIDALNLHIQDIDEM